ncbi:MAG: ribosomal protein S18-alanine N-acetyltransferase [Calditrichaeota bacterium]|nr:ribosomal protein S18-alanine N-acetyltransferase [Calditrichota bacterium]
MIRPAKQTDLDTILRIHRENFERPWTDEQLIAELKQSNRRFFVAESDARIQGYLIASILSGEAELLSIAVEKSYQRQGIASELLNALLVSIQSATLFLEVSRLNEAAISFYRKHGFQEIAIRRNYYQDKSDALIMRLSD